MQNAQQRIKQLLKWMLIVTSMGLFIPNTYAETLEAEESAPVIEVEAEIEPSKILSIEVGDWNQDGATDSAILLKEAGEVALSLYLADDKGEQILKLHKENIAWSGDFSGTLPSLKKHGKQDSLLIHSENDAVGRGRWQQTLTIAYRDETFMVVGYTYNSHDTLDPETNLSCDVNLVTGKGFKNDKAVTLKAKRFKLRTWTDGNIPDICRE